jgi:hypothetical protein
MIKIDRPDCPHPRALENEDYKHPKNKAALKDASHGKCMYCESKVSHVDYAHVEHIKPKDSGLFPELKFVWSNLGYSCALCNGKKSNKYFPDAPFINPYDEDPGDHIFAFGAFLFNKNGSERGEITIREIGLNRPALVEQRSNKISSISKAIDACCRTTSTHLRASALQAIKEEAAADREFSAVVAGLLKAQQLI